MATVAGGFNNSGAALSPPGALSQRTDMQSQSPMAMPDAAYGEQSEFQQLQGGAPMAGAPMTPPPIPMGAPTMRPGEPLTAGAPIGDGPGPEILPSNDPYSQDMQLIARYLPQFESMAAQEDTPDSFRLFVRYIRGSR
jgi:hypothetical protein